MVQLDAALMTRLAIGKVFASPDDAGTTPVNSLDISGDGELVVTAADDESCHLYAVSQGRRKKTLLAKKNGVEQIKFTHASHAVICAGNDFYCRYWSLHDNQYLRYFRGHRDRITSLAMCPKDDSFISASLDRTIR